MLVRPLPLALAPASSVTAPASPVTAPASTAPDLFSRYSLCQPSSEAVARHVRYLHGTWQQEQAPLAPQSLPPLAPAPSSPLPAVLASCSDPGQKLLVRGLMVAHTLQVSSLRPMEQEPGYLEIVIFSLID